MTRAWDAGGKREVLQSEAQDGIPALPCPSAGTLKRRHLSRGPRLSSCKGGDRPHLSSVSHCAWIEQGSRVIIFTSAMELIFEDKILIILKILFLIGPSLSRLAFTALEE